MKTQIYEGLRVQVNNSNSVIATFKERHDTVPFVTLLLEDDTGNIVPVITDVNQFNVTVSFSQIFTGYLHVHAFSKLAVV